MSKLSREMKILAKQAGGSHKTVHDRNGCGGPVCWSDGSPPDA